MRISLLMGFVFCTVLLQAQEKYRVRVNDTVIMAAPGVPYQLGSGNRAIHFFIEELDTLFYHTPMYGFRHFKEYKISKTEFSKNNFQLLLASPAGSGLLIQEFNTLNPEGIPEIMLKEITKEKISYGYVMTRSNYQRKIASGQSLDVIRAELKYKESMTVFEIAAFGGKDSGVLIITQLEDGDFSEEGKRIINLMWSSLESYFK